MRLLLSVIFAALAGLSTAPATSLEKLSFDEMVTKATAIVRGRIAGSHVQKHGSIVYTHYTVHVSETYKGGDNKTYDVVLPGGTLNGNHQTFSGIPVLPSDSEVVLFLWTSRSGLTHLLGLSQGLFETQSDASGATTVVRRAIREGMVTNTGRPAQADTLRMSLSEFSSRVRSAGSTR